MRGRLLFLVACISLLGIAVFLPVSSSALTTGEGEIDSTKSWTLLNSPWYDASGLGFDQLETFIIGITYPFHEDGQYDYTVGGWSATLINPKYSNATGPEIGPYGNMKWDEKHVGNLFNGMSVVRDYMAWNDGTLVEAGRGSFNVGGSTGQWNIYNEQWVDYPISTFDPNGDIYDRSPVPVPTTLLLFGSGLMGLAGVRKKFRMK